VVQPRVRWRAFQSAVHRHYGSPVVAARDGGGRGGRGGAGGAHTGDGAVVKRLGDGGKAAVMKARGGDELRRERGGKEGGVGCGEMRRGWVPFIGAEGERYGRTVEGNGRWQWSAMMVVEAAVSGWDRTRSDGGEWCSGCFRSGKGRGAGRQHVRTRCSSGGAGRSARGGRRPGGAGWLGRIRSQARIQEKFFSNFN
jgi:hypothetical protein